MSVKASSPSSSPAAPNSQSPLQSPLEPSFGWTQYAEKINGRFAMIGFVALLVTEFFTQQDFFSWLGLR